MDKPCYLGVNNKDVKQSIQLIDALLNRVRQDEEIQKNHITMTWRYIGSASHHFVTMKEEQNPHFDVDCNITIRFKKNVLEAKETRDLFIRAFDRHLKKSFKPVRNGKRVLTLWCGAFKILFSVDFAIFNNQVSKEGEKFEILVRNPESDDCHWEDQKARRDDILKKKDFCFHNNHYDEAFAYYLTKKNEFGDSKESREIYADTLNHIWQKYHSSAKS